MGKKEKKEKTENAHRRTQSCVQSFTVGLNVLDRDEKHINDTINLNFEDVLAEPDASPSRSSPSSPSGWPLPSSASSTSSSSTSARSWWLSCKRPSSPWPALSALAS